MRSALFTAAIAALTTSSSAINILLNNDDGFGSANIREFYRLLKKAGHEVLMVAPVNNESGQGGRSSYSNLPTLAVPSEYGLIPAGAPALGTDPNDSNIWYYNGTPAACTFVALDYVIPKYWSNRTIDLFVAGPNFGDNLGPFLYTLSGTMGATYAAVGRGLPGIAFSGGNSEQRSYKWINATTTSEKPDPATILAQLAVDVVEQLVNNTKKGDRLLPIGYGMNVNNPVISSLTNTSCVAPPFVQTRLSGGAFTDSAVYNATKGTFTYGNYVGSGVNRCISGNCALPGETDVVGDGCYSSVSVFTVDYDAPRGADQASVREALTPLVVYENPDRMVRKVRRSESDMAERAPLRHE
jgi:5'-nucleotidase